jgi:hypothetical protein
MQVPFDGSLRQSCGRLCRKKRLVDLPGRYSLTRAARDHPQDLPLAGNWFHKTPSLEIVEILLPGCDEIGRIQMREKINISRIKILRVVSDTFRRMVFQAAALERFFSGMMAEPFKGGVP